MTLRELYLEVQKQNPKALDYTLLIQDNVPEAEVIKIEIDWPIESIIIS
jgi:hypothetical protein